MSYITSGKVKLDFDANGHNDPLTSHYEIEHNARGGYLKLPPSCSTCRCVNDNAGGLRTSSILETRPGVRAPSIEAVAAVMRGPSIRRACLVGSSMAGYGALQFCCQHRKRANDAVTIRKRRTASIRVPSNAAMVHCTTLQPLNNFVNEAEPTIGGRGGYYTVYPRGRGASAGPAPDGYVMVSRWVSSEEVGSWLENGGTAIRSGIGEDRVYVTLPDAVQPAGTGPIRIDFAVPQSALVKVSNAQWRMIMQPIQSTPIHNVTIAVPNGTTLQNWDHTSK
jgi:hypothetical protein